MHRQHATERRLEFPPHLANIMQTVIDRKQERIKKLESAMMELIDGVDNEIETYTLVADLYTEYKELLKLNEDE